MDKVQTDAFVNLLLSLDDDFINELIGIAKSSPEDRCKFFLFWSNVKTKKIHANIRRNSGYRLPKHTNEKAGKTYFEGTVREGLALKLKSMATGIVMRRAELELYGSVAATRKNISALRNSINKAKGIMKDRAVFNQIKREIYDERTGGKKFEDVFDAYCTGGISMPPSDEYVYQKFNDVLEMFSALATATDRRLEKVRVSDQCRNEGDVVSQEIIDGAWRIWSNVFGKAPENETPSGPFYKFIRLFLEKAGVIKTGQALKEALRRQKDAIKKEALGGGVRPKQKYF